MSGYFRELHNLVNGRVCGQCEYFDGVYGDCLSHQSDRFQTEEKRGACSAFYPSTSPNGVSDSDGGECD